MFLVWSRRRSFMTTSPGKKPGNYKRYHPIPGELVAWVTSNQTCTYTLPLLLKIIDTSDVHTFELTAQGRRSINLARLASQWHCHKRSVQRAMTELVEMKLVANYVFRSGYRNVNFVLTFDYHNYDSGYCQIPAVLGLHDFFSIVARGRKKKPPFTPLEPKLAAFRTPKVIHKDINNAVNSCGYNVDNSSESNTTALQKGHGVTLQSAMECTPYVHDYIQDYTYDLLNGSRGSMRERFGRSRYKAWADDVRRRGIVKFTAIEWYYHELLSSADFHEAFCSWLHPAIPAATMAYDRLTESGQAFYQSKLDDVVALGWKENFRPETLIRTLQMSASAGGDEATIRKACFDYMSSSAFADTAATKHRLYPDTFPSPMAAMFMENPLSSLLAPHADHGVDIVYEMKALHCSAIPDAWRATPDRWIDYLKQLCRLSLPGWEVLCDGSLSEYNDVLLHKERR